MEKVLFGIFAHPDDEAFGPSASLLHAASHETDVHLILVTDGEQGNNPDNLTDLNSVRIQEWEKSAKLIGASSWHALHYPDGELSNNLYLEIAQKIIDRILNILKSYREPVELTCMTYEPSGITGHLDHIAVSYITTYVYCKIMDLNPDNVTFNKLKYFCLPKCIAPTTNTQWLYMSSGKTDKECDELFDYSDMLEQKLAIMQAHHSQREDMKTILALQESTSSDCRYKDHFYYFHG